MRWLPRTPLLPILALAAAVALPGLPRGAVQAQAGENPSEESATEPVSDVVSFVDGFEALPLMPGLHNVTGSSVVFDTPTGRIVEAAIAGMATAAEVKAFYARSLPQLGWDRFLETEYRREGEVLKLEIAGDADHVVVHFFLSPK